MLESQPRNEFEKYIYQQRIVIADANKSSRVGIARALADMGAVTSQMVLVDSYEWAKEAIAQTKPGIIVLDFYLDSFCALDLLQDEARSDQPLTIVVTHNNSHGAVARAAEDDIDAFITKPYNLETFRESIKQAVLRKLNPTEYIKTINEGRQLLSLSEFERASLVFKKATQLNERPALAYFYHGQAQKLNQAIEQAQASYTKGLEYNRLHYKCLLGLHEALIAQNKVEEAYAVLRQIIHSFPLNPNRFVSLLKLAISNRRFEDVENYYDSFLQMEIRGDDVVKHICAALITAGKHFLKQSQTEKALSVFQKAGVSAAGRTVFLREIILALADAGVADEIDKYLIRFPQEARATTEYQTLDYLAVSMLKPLHVILKQGHTLLKNGHHDPTIYRIMIQATAKAGRHEIAEDLMNEAIKRWPEKKGEYFSLLAAQA